MKPRFTTVWLAAVFALTAAAAAQQQPGTSGNPGSDGVTASADVQQTSKAVPTDQLALTGCLDRAPNGTYELRKARLSRLGSTQPSDAPATTTGVTGTSGVTSAAKAPITEVPMTWTLQSTTDLAPHVGHEIQVTGRPTVAPGASGSNTATTSDPTTTATGARMKSASEDARSIDVQAVRMISASCS